MMYLGLALLGLVQPFRHYLGWWQAHGFSIGSTFDAWGAGMVQYGLGWAVSVATAAVIVWAVAETRVRQNWSALWIIPVTFVVGIGCGLPLYLFLRTRPVV